MLQYFNPDIDYCSDYFKVIDQYFRDSISHWCVFHFWFFLSLFWLFLVLFSSEWKMRKFISVKGYFPIVEYHKLKCYLCNEEANCQFIVNFCKKNILNQCQTVSQHAKAVRMQNLDFQKQQAQSVRNFCFIVVFFSFLISRIKRKNY